MSLLAKGQPHKESQRPSESWLGDPRIPTRRRHLAHCHREALGATPQDAPATDLTPKLWLAHFSARHVQCGSSPTNGRAAPPPSAGPQTLIQANFGISYLCFRHTIRSPAHLTSFRLANRQAESVKMPVCAVPPSKARIFIPVIDSLAIAAGAKGCCMRRDGRGM